MDQPSLRLKKQSAPARPRPAESLRVSRVLVDTGVFHLDQPFDYLVPEKYTESIETGSLVRVPFSGRECIGIVLERCEDNGASNLKFIEKPLTQFPTLTPSTIALIDRSAKRYASSFWEIYKEAVPPRVATVERLFLGSSSTSNENSVERIRELRLLEQGRLYTEQLVKIAQSQLTQGQVLIIVPDEKDINLLSQEIEKTLKISPVLLTASLDRSERYRNYLHILRSNPELIVGTRNSVFVPLQPGATIIIYGDGEESLVSRRHPNWSVRDIALLRSEECNLIFASFTPTLEILRLVEIGWMKMRAIQQSVVAQCFEGSNIDHRLIKSALTRGSVLVTVSGKGYINSFSCQKCRNHALCDCGGRLFIDKGKRILCSLCQKIQSDWKCSHCGGVQPRSIARGSERILEELGRAHPGISLISSSSDNPVLRLPEGIHLVVATNGCEPLGLYESVVLLHGDFLFNRVSIRGDESARRHWFAALSMMKPNSTALISLPNEDPISQSLMRWSLSPQVEIEMSERKGAELPPYARLATLKGAPKEIAQLRAVLSELPLFTTISQIDSAGKSEPESMLVLRSPIEKSEELSNFFYDFSRVRSLKSLPHVDLRLDPFEL